jgi:membrane associated rhomboid family serine protease
MAINIGVFVCDAILKSQKIELSDYLALSVEGLQKGYIWQILTFQFMHGGIMHIFLNMLTLYFIGRMLEAGIGKKEFLRLYLISGAFGGLLQIGCSWIAPQHFGSVAVVGASAGVFGVVGAYAALYPYQRLTLLLFFVIPISMQAKTLIYLAGAMALYGIIFPGDNIAHAAHLGGMICGILYLRSHHLLAWRRPHNTGPRGNNNSKWFSNPVQSFKIYGGSAPVERQPRPEESRTVTVVDVEEEDDFMEKKVDPILDKITRQGIQSLTAEEREILEKAHKRMKRD